MPTKENIKNFIRGFNSYTSTFHHTDMWVLKTDRPENVGILTESKLAAQELSLNAEIKQLGLLREQSQETLGGETGAMNSQFDKRGREIHCMRIGDWHSADIEVAKSAFCPKRRQECTDILGSYGMAYFFTHAKVEALEVHGCGVMQKECQNCLAAKTSTISEIQMA
jgi:hypothetical protein